MRGAPYRDIGITPVGAYVPPCYTGHESGPDWSRGRALSGHGRNLETDEGAMKRTVAVSRATKRAKKPPSRAPLVVILSAAFTLGTTFLILVSLVVAGGIGVYRYYQSVVP